MTLVAKYVGIPVIHHAECYSNSDNVSFEINLALTIFEVIFSQFDWKVVNLILNSFARTRLEF